MDFLRKPIQIPVPDTWFSMDGLWIGVVEQDDSYTWLLTIATPHFRFHFNCDRSDAAPGPNDDRYVLDESSYECRKLHDHFRKLLALENLIKQRIVSISVEPGSETMVSGIGAAVEKIESLLLELHRIGKTRQPRSDLQYD
ncbi:MAG: hypothetical protein Q9212_002358 [Teloschistes hypoglaucus]